jgi:very-short-patch-repair endonuclease
VREERAVIVGDYEQISPAAIGVVQSKVYGLMAHYLDGIPQANSLDVQTSLYDIATRIFPGKLMLKEHFRCVPEIIQFSNDLSYGGGNVPLRLPNKEERIEPAIHPVRIPGFRGEGTKVVNEVEADQIVSDIKDLIENSFFSDRTIGIISLLGKHQAQLIENKLRDEIWAEEIINRKIICGDAYNFQDDERDSIFLSLVIADNVRFTALTRKDAQQRFNVAVSRAQNQLRLYHSVDLDDLSSKDLRYRLLEYCLNPKRIINEMEDAQSKCESQFEIDVFRMLVSRGYTVRLQVQAGKFRIDLVEEGISSRLAIECDGDRWHGVDKWEEDMERQRTLERVGWVFWRVRGSDFYRDRISSMSSIWSRLDEMNIQPFKKDDVHQRETIKDNQQVKQVSDTSNEIRVNIKPQQYDELINHLNQHSLKYIDKLQSNGALWVIGGEELSKVLNEIEHKGYRFKYAANGSKTTKSKAAWYIK